jgi:hypothetical protein
VSTIARAYAAVEPDTMLMHYMSDQAEVAGGMFPTVLDAIHLRLLHG